VQQLAVVAVSDVVLLRVTSLQLDVDGALVDVLGDDYFQLPDGEVGEGVELDEVRINALPELNLGLKREPLEEGRVFLIYL